MVESDGCDSDGSGRVGGEKVDELIAEGRRGEEGQFEFDEERDATRRSKEQGNREERKDSRVKPSIEVVGQERFESSSWSGDELLPHAAEASEDSSEGAFHRGSWERSRSSREGVVVDLGEE